MSISPTDTPRRWGGHVPSDPRILRLRAQMGTAVRDGHTALAEKLRHELAVIKVGRELGAVAPKLTDAERSDLAAILFGGAA